MFFLLKTFLAITISTSHGFAPSQGLGSGNLNLGRRTPTQLYHHNSIADHIKASYPSESFSEEFLSSLPSSLAPSPSTSATEKTTKQATTFLRLPAMSLLSRSHNIFSPSMSFYSPSTSILSLTGFLRLTKILDIGFGGETDVDVVSVEVLGENVAVFETRCKGAFGPGARLQIKGICDFNSVELDNLTDDWYVRGEYEVGVIQFGNNGEVKSLSYGGVLKKSVVPECPEIKQMDLSEEEAVLSGSGEEVLSGYEEDDEVKQLRQTISDMYDKLETLRGQESSMGFMKQKMDIDDFELALNTKLGEILNQRSNTGNGKKLGGGLRGILFAVGRRIGKYQTEEEVPAPEAINRAFMEEDVGDGDEGSGSGWGEQGWKPEEDMGGISTPAANLHAVEFGITSKQNEKS